MRSKPDPRSPHSCPDPTCLGDPELPGNPRPCPLPLLPRAQPPLDLAVLSPLKGQGSSTSRSPPSHTYTLEIRAQIRTPKGPTPRQVCNYAPSSIAGKVSSSSLGEPGIKSKCSKKRVLDSVSPTNPLARNRKGQLVTSSPIQGLKAMNKEPQHGTARSRSGKEVFKELAGEFRPRSFHRSMSG